MRPFTPEEIKDIAENIDMGMLCNIHKETGETITLPDMDELSSMDTEGWDEDIDKVEQNSADYFVIRKPESFESFKFMEDFTEGLPEKLRLKQRLFDALNRRKPFREFKNVINDSGEYRELWFAYKNERMQEWVKVQIEGFGEVED